MSYSEMKQFIIEYLSKAFILLYLMNLHEKRLFPSS